MCGIAGIVFKKENGVGKTLVDMLSQLQHRGNDSVGFAIYGGLELGPNEYQITLEVLKNKSEIYNAIDAEIKHQEELSKEIFRYTIFSSSYGHVGDIVGKLNSIEGISVLGGGKYEIIKDIGCVSEVASKFDVIEKKGTHGIGHVRFSTESAVDRYRAHPFQSYIYPDVTVVHNGQITNCLKLRSKLEKKGHKFSTDNDTEVIVHYIADKLMDGFSLEEALKESVREMDGPFTYIIATDNAIGVAMDKLGLRPGIVYEDNELFAVASEKVALERIAKDGSIDVLASGEVRVLRVEK